MKTKVFNLIILDESGSMSCIKSQALNGLNETLQTIRKAQKKYPDQEQLVSIVLSSLTTSGSLETRFPSGRSMISVLTSTTREPALPFLMPSALVSTASGNKYPMTTASL